MMKKRQYSLLILLMCICLGLAPAALAYEPVICDTTTVFYAYMADLDYAFSTLDNSTGNSFCKTFKDCATDAGSGWDAAYTLTLEGTGDELEGRMTSMTYDAALGRTFAPGKTDRVLEKAYEAFLSAAGMQLSDSDSRRFSDMYSSSRMWQVLGRAMDEDFNPGVLSARFGDWEIYIDVAYGDNEMHFFFYMTR